MGAVKVTVVLFEVATVPDIPAPPLIVKFVPLKVPVFISSLNTATATNDVIEILLDPFAGEIETTTGFAPSASVRGSDKASKQGRRTVRGQPFPC